MPGEEPGHWPGAACKDGAQRFGGEMSALQGQTVLVLGLGESGLAMARWCAAQGAAVRVSLVCFGNSEQGARLDGESAGKIFADLSAGPTVRQAAASTWVTTPPPRRPAPTSARRRRKRKR